MRLRLLLRAQWDRVAAVALMLLGGVVLLLGYLGVSESEFAEEQLSYIASGGLLGVSLVGIGVGLLVSADLHDEWRKLDRIEAAIRGEPRPDVLRDRGVEVTDEPAHREASDGTETSDPATVRPQSRLRAPQSAALAANGEASGTLTVDWRGVGAHRMAVVAGAGTCAAWAVMATGWAQASVAHDFEAAVRGVGIGTLGLGVGIVAVASYVVRFRQRIVFHRTRILARWSSDAIVAPAVGPTPLSSELVFVVPHQTHYHRENCVLTQRRELIAVSVKKVDAALRPCAICDPT